MRWGGEMRGREREGEERVENWVVGNWELGDLLFVCVKISDMILFKMKGICVNVNYIILTYAISHPKGGEFDENSPRVRDSGASLRSGASASLLKPW